MSRRHRSADGKGGLSAKLAGQFNEAVRLHRAGQGLAAEAACRRLLESDPRHGDAWHLLGLIAVERDRFDLAEQLVRQALSFRQRDPAIHSNFGNILIELGRFDEAEQAFGRALGLRGDFLPARANLAHLLQRCGRLEAAEEHYRLVLSQAPENVDAHANLGLILKEQWRLDEAEAALRHALHYHSEHAESLCNLGLVLWLQGKPDDGLAVLRRSLVLQPSLPEAFNGMATIFRRSDDLPRAAVALVRAIRLRPTYAEAHSNLGLIELELNRLTGAIARFSDALSFRPSLAEAHFGRSLALLKLGQWPAAWPDYDYRWRQTASPAEQLRDYAQPLWSGDPAGGRAILIWQEQGFGDAIQFIRFALHLAEDGWRVIVEVRRPLNRLFAGLSAVTVVGSGEPLPDFDVHCPLLSLPGRLGIRLDGLARGRPYLSPRPDLTAQWQARLCGSRGLRVGIAWRGNSQHSRDRARSIAPDYFGKFIDVPGLHLVSLQKDGRPEEFAALGLGQGLRNAGPDLDDFADLAGLLVNLDLVITVDTAICHLAGALGVPCWTLLDSACDWRWLEQGDRTVWYPTMRLLRQEKRGDWLSVAARVRSALSDLLLAGDPAANHFDAVGDL